MGERLPVKRQNEHETCGDGVEKTQTKSVSGGRGKNKRWRQGRCRAKALAAWRQERMRPLRGEGRGRGMKDGEGGEGQHPRVHCARQNAQKGQKIEPRKVSVCVRGGGKRADPERYPAFATGTDTYTIPLARA